MPAHSFEYAILRVVPRVDRDEFVNAGVILYCRDRGFLAARVSLDTARLLALHPAAAADLDAIQLALAAVPRIAAGDPDAGPIAQLDQAERFRWLVAPKSTITQTGPVHAGLCDDPATTLDHLLATMVTI